MLAPWRPHSPAVVAAVATHLNLKDLSLGLVEEGEK